MNDVLRRQEALWRAHKDTCDVCGVWELGDLGDGPPACERGAVIFSDVTHLRRLERTAVRLWVRRAVAS